jgi:hypothetical protein
MKELIAINSNLLQKLNSGFQLSTVLDQEHLALVCFISGTQFYNLNKVKNKLVKNESLLLKRQADNEYDKLAVAVYINDVQIGHIPRRKNEMLARLMDSGKQFIAKIKNAETAGPSEYEIEIEVFLKD